MWFLLFCTATPLAVTCTAPVQMPSKVICENIGEKYKALATRAHAKSAAIAQCVDDKWQGNIEVPIPPLKMP